MSKYFERPEGTQEDVAEMDVLRNCACSFLQHETFYAGENMLAASDVARFYSGHPRYLLRPETLSLHAKGTKNMKMGSAYYSNISKCFKRPESTQKNVAELDVLRNCVCRLLQHEPPSFHENVLAVSDVARF